MHNTIGPGLQKSKSESEFIFLLLDDPTDVLELFEALERLVYGRSYSRGVPGNGFVL